MRSSNSALSESSPSAPSRRRFLQAALTVGGSAALCPALGAGRVVTPPSASALPEVKSFELEETTIAKLQDGMKSGKFTARSLVEKYMGRIDEIDKRGPAVNA